ncbi:N-acetyltransferase [Flavonifractor sp.]|uniref:GNAT family N-acetyltransferase n=1 Tax=Flavonifractor sp. TaxID=2049025 RepID=UPI0025C14712|nr:GNAT family N-acetyltransferase [Flavonifractor sp.]
MDCITLQNVDESNFLACFSLELDAQQEKFVSHPIRSLAQAYVYRGQCTPFAVCRAGEVVGYLMVIYDYDEEAYFIWHLMIDARHQGRGYGRAAMEAALAYIRSKPFGDSSIVRLTVSPENSAACHLYQTLGFSPTGRADEDEIELERVLD